MMRADLLTTLAIFGKPVYPTIDAVGLIGREQMKESKFFEEVLEEGRVEGRRAALLETLDVRFGPGSAAKISEVLRPLNDEEQLMALQRVASTCRRLSDFRRALGEATSGT